MNNLALFEEARRMDSAAEELYQKALEQGERAHGRDSALLLPTLNDYAHLLRRTRRETKAAGLEARARALERRKAESPAR